jgi:hypothetical protein
MGPPVWQLPVRSNAGDPLWRRRVKRGCAMLCSALLRECARGMQNKIWWINDSSYVLVLVLLCCCVSCVVLCCAVLCCALCLSPVTARPLATRLASPLTTHSSPPLSPLLSSPVLSSRLAAPPTDLDSPIIQFTLAGTPRLVLACFWPALACAPGPAPHRTAPPFAQPNFDTTTRPPPPPALTHSLTHSSHNQQRAARTSCKSCICLSNSTAQHSDTRLRELDSSRSTPGPRFTRRPHPRSVPSLRPLQNQHPPPPPRST